ncbi:hypothetical protein [Sandarakinorhabdus rubra]|uniref:hypothetical protein n=1 Tax=Sandarakinorhabdus rubra TaxID=2672568 RepID=UPI0013DB9F67|nr:hypothetical protein [Sandarakinorhabdus rubra]
MGFLFDPYREGHCCLCGVAAPLTGEHKVKASAIRAMFGSTRMVIGQFGGGRTYRNAQGPKSKALHHSAGLCADCNGARTQPADREFDRLHKLALGLHAAGADPSTVFQDERYVESGEPYASVFRYFAKLLCCHMGDVHGPRPVQLSAFAIGELAQNRVFLSIDRDPNYRDWSTVSGDHAYAAHGGLAVIMDRKTELPAGIRSYLTLGPIRYRYWMEFAPIEATALAYFHQDFWQAARAAMQKHIDNPCTDEQLERMGF